METDMTPKVSVLMPVYNAEAFIRPAIESILAQDLQDFEFLIIDDGSTDGSLDAIRSYDDKRIILVVHKENKGLVQTLNEGVALAKTPYIARMDADDLSAPTRLTKQRNFLESHAKVVAVGSDADVIDAQGEQVSYQPTVVTHAAIERILAVASPFVHGSVMFRKEAVHEAGGYRPSAYLVEDYDLWSRLAQAGELANIPQPLYSWRRNPASESHAKLAEQRRALQEIRDRNWQTFGQRGPALPADWPAIWSKANMIGQHALARRLQMAHFHIYFARGYRQRAQWFVAVRHLFAAWLLVPTFLPFYYYYLVLTLLPWGWFEQSEKALLEWWARRRLT